MNRLANWLGIDARHYRALLKLAWRLDMRTSKMGIGWQQSGHNPRVTFFITLIYYLLFGIIFAWMTFSASSVFVGCTLTGSGLIFVLGGILLIEYNSIVITPDDYHILGYQPLSSRTYFFAKLTNLLAYISVFAVVLGGPSIFVHMLKGGFHPLRGLAALAALAMLTFVVVAFVVMIYGQLMRVVEPHRLKSVITYLQLAISLLIYTGYFFIPRFFEGRIEGIQMVKQGWMLLLPTSWFAAVTELGYGRVDRFNLFALLMGVMAAISLWRSLSSHISLDYAARVAAYMEAHAGAQPKSVARRKRRSLVSLLPKPEQRVVARLTLAQFRYDNKFRLSVVAVIPLLALYFFLGTSKGNLPDPFLSGAASAEDFSIFFFAVLMIPAIIKQSIDASDDWAASWIFFASPCRLDRLILAARTALFAVLALPVLGFLLILFLISFDNWVHAVLHTVTFALLSFWFIQLIYFFQPRLPFAQPRTRGAQSRSYIAALLVLPIIGLVLLYVVTGAGYRSSLTLGITYGVFLLAMLSTEWLIIRRIRSRMRSMQFSD